MAHIQTIKCHSAGLTISAIFQIHVQTAGLQCEQPLVDRTTASLTIFQGRCVQETLSTIHVTCMHHKTFL